MVSFSANLDPVEFLVDAGRRRVTAQISKRERFLALSFLLGGVCGFLFFGADFFPVLLVLLIAALGVYLAWNRQREREPGSYAVAQIVDSRGGLEDRFATAYYFRTAAGGDLFVGAQYEQARKAASTVRLESVFPDESPPTVRAAMILAVVGLLLFGIRVVLQPQLSMQPPLPTVIMAAIFGDDWNQRREAVIERAATADQAEDDAAFADDAAKLSSGAEADPLLQTELLANEQFEPPPEDSQWKPEVEGLAVNPEEDIDGGELPLDIPSQGLEEDSDQGAGEEARSQDDAEDDWSDEAQSLLDKLKQAFENLIETFDMASTESGEPGSSESEKSAEEGSAGDEPGEGESDMPGEQASGAEMEGGEPTDQAGDSSEAPGQGGEDSNERPGSGESSSAAGSNEGSKELAEAEQMQAMGELEQLFMERAENMSGEVTVETRFAEQSAAVPFNNRATTHSDRGGEVSRDEIPAEYRTYIRNYFEILRRNDNKR